MKQKIKKKVIELKTEFNPGTMKYEPKLPLREKSVKGKTNWELIIILLIILVISIGIFLWILQKRFL